MKWIDDLLNRITMYRLVLYYLIALVAAAFVLGLFHIGPAAPLSLAWTALVTIAVCWFANRLFGSFFEVPTNAESAYVTALILVLIIDPVDPLDWRRLGALVFIALWAMASKFVFAVRRRHVFNPAAFAVALSAITIGEAATWWVGGNVALLLVVLIGGLLVVRKIRRFDLVAVYLFATFAAILATTAPSAWLGALRETLLHSPLFFFAFVMLTEPLTAPTTRWRRLAFAALIGVLSAPNVHVGSFYLTPELTLLIGNLFGFLIDPQRRSMLTLDRIEQVAHDAYDFVFRADRKLAFEPGQYAEWTLHVDNPDNRGNRRYFTVASAPTEREVRLGVKFYAAASAFKKRLAELSPGDRMFISPVAGDFTLPADSDAKLAFLAGGVGITPFRSMLQYLIDRDEPRDIIVLYGN
ncbi:MAG TPA: RnfABCDGE type electron transport complex subunit D, partial [Bauldia sp.]|nr:RnfABCDGE type electron transport complex subunit D [Bauldia sp.]